MTLSRVARSVALSLRNTLLAPSGAGVRIRRMFAVRRGYLALALLLAVSHGCGLAARRARTSIDEARLERARELTAEKRAPLAYERYQQARAAAQKSPEESGARGDYQALARLWLDVAISEAERQVSSERRLDAERALVELDAQLLKLERERSELARENELGAARQIAFVEAQRALARAAERRDLRVKLPREEVKRASEALVARAELISLTLAAFGQETPALGRLRGKIGETRALIAREPEASLARADETLFFALSLFSSLRSSQAAPSEEEKAALLEELTLAGLQVSRGDRGLSAVLAAPFAGSELKPEAARVLERLCAVARAHPSGSVHVSAQAKTQAQAEARAKHVREHLARAECSGERFAFTKGTREGDELEASFLAY